MSLDSFNTIMSPHASREDRIAVLASETDIATGMIDLETDMDKGYFENQGPSEDTGTVYAALCDILDMIHGRETGQTMNFAGLIEISAAGQIGIGGAVATEPAVVNCLRGRTCVSGGDLDLGSGLAVVGLTQLSNAVFNTADGEYVKFNFLDLDIEEQIIPSRDGETLDLLEYAEDACLTLHLHGVDADAVAIRTALGGGSASNYMPINFNVESEQYGRIFSLGREGNLILGPQNWDYTDYNIWMSTAALTLFQDESGNGIHYLNLYSNEDIGTQAINLRSFGANTSHWQIYHVWNAPDVSLLRFYNGTQAILDLTEDYVRVVCPSGKENYFEVYGDSSRWAQLHCKLDPVPGRTIASPSSINAGLLLGSGREDFSGRLGFDGWHEWNSLRLFVDDYSGADCVPTVAIGEPLGTNTAPIDALIVMKDPYGAGVGVDHRDLYANHATKDGLHVGIGQNDNGMLWLWGSSGYYPGIHLGVDRGSSAPILFGGEDGIPRIVAGDTSVAQLGTAKGDWCIPIWITTNAMDGTENDLIAYALETQISNDFPGSGMMVINTSLEEAQLWIRDSTDQNGNYYIFTATGMVSAS